MQPGQAGPQIKELDLNQWRSGCVDGKLGPSLSTVHGPLAAAALGTTLPVTRARDLRYHRPQHTDGGGKIHRGEQCPQDSEQIGGQAGTQTQLTHLPRPAPPWVCTGGRRRLCRPDDVHSPPRLARRGPSCPIAFGLGHTTCFRQQGGCGCDAHHSPFLGGQEMQGRDEEKEGERESPQGTGFAT